MPPAHGFSLRFTAVHSAYLLLEVSRNARLPCDAPLHTFVGFVGALGLAFALVDFLHDVFKDPMPPVTKLEQGSQLECGCVGLVLVGRAGGSPFVR